MCNIGGMLSRTATDRFELFSCRFNFNRAGCMRLYGAEFFWSRGEYQTRSSLGGQSVGKMWKGRRNEHRADVHCVKNLARETRRMGGSRRYRYKCAVLTGQRKTNSVPACVGKFLKHAASPDKCSRDEIEPASFCFAAVKNYTDSQYRKENHFSAGTLSNYTTSFIPQLWFSSETFSATLQLCFAKHSRFIKVNEGMNKSSFLFAFLALNARGRV